MAAAIRRRCAILFVGAGISMAVGLPSWQSLIDHLLDDRGDDRDVIDGMHGGYQMLAEYWPKRGGIGPWRSWLDRNWRVDPGALAAAAAPLIYYAPVYGPPALLWTLVPPDCPLLSARLPL
ncbi:hypothetical protein ML401_23830 [Bradyrhizobium sp. 62B]|uniref:hypothetical protein n=1 Tax=Bradyrhizobium sp. 62B TaxID=2898442 RepID=UPI0025581272|nr:hypothetical protein ML401_23830 [Bradyrhizobium sp. 62B]